MDAMDRLVEIMARLRGPDGCPWDKEQTPSSLRTYVLEEAYETAEAIDGGDWDALKGELGDLLLQIVFLARLAQEQARFDMTDVAEAISTKLVRRHPHVFADGAARTVDDVWKRWDEIKDEERREGGSEEAPRSRLDGIPRLLPALAQARLLADKAARVGFDWPSSEAIVGKITEETDEVQRALATGDRQAAAAEIGDLLFAVASLARRLKLDPETCLAGANRKFRARFRAAETMAAERGRRLEDLSGSELDALWESAKTQSP